MATIIIGTRALEEAGSAATEEQRAMAAKLA